jgi:hypothetical protein
MAIFGKIAAKLGPVATKAAMKISAKSPAILVGVGIIAGAAALVEVFRKTPEGAELIEKHAAKLEQIEDAKENPEKYEHDDGTPVDEKSYVVDKKHATKTMVKEGFKLYWKAILLSIISVVCILGGFKILSGRLATVSAAAASYLAENRKLSENIITKYGEAEYRNLLYSDKEKMAAEHVDIPLTEAEQADPWRKYKMPDPDVDSAFAFSYNEDTVDERHWMPSKIMTIMHLKSVQENLNTMILPSKVILTENEVLEAVGLSRFKSAVHHDELFIHGKSVINFGIDDLIEDVEYDLQVMKDEDRTSFGALEAKYANVPLVLHILPTTTTLEVINDKISWRDS